MRTITTYFGRLCKVYGKRLEKQIKICLIANDSRIREQTKERKKVDS